MKKSLLLFMPHARDVKPKTVSSIVLMGMHLAAGMNKDIGKIGFWNPANCSNIAKIRNKAVEKAQGEDFSHVLMIDDDMVFQPDAAGILLSHDKAIVGANYVTKNQLKARWTAVSLDGYSISSAERTGIERVSGIGMGLCMIDVKRVLEMEKPLFKFEYDDNVHIGEDYSFCRRAPEVWVDHDLSKSVWHVGDALYGGCGLLPEDEVI